MDACALAVELGSELVYAAGEGAGWMWRIEQFRMRVAQPGAGLLGRFAYQPFRVDSQPGCALGGQNIIVMEIAVEQDRAGHRRAQPPPVDRRGMAHCHRDRTVASARNLCPNRPQ